MRLAAAALALALSGVPLAIRPSPAVAFGAAAAALLTLAGTAVRAKPLTTAGVSVAWIVYVVALFGSPASVHVASAVAVGLLSFVLLETVDFADRFHALPLPRAVVASQVAWWAAFGLAVAALIAVATLLATIVTRPMPPALAIAITFAASVVAVISVLRLLRS